MSAPHLITPLDWSIEALARAAADGADLREAAAARVESARFRVCAERIAELQTAAERLQAERDALAARLAEIERAEPVAWIERELQGTGARHLHFERRPYCLRDDVIAPVWTALIARPEPQEGGAA